MQSICDDSESYYCLFGPYSSFYCRRSNKIDYVHVIFKCILHALVQIIFSIKLIILFILLISLFVLCLRNIEYTSNETARSQIRDDHVRSILPQFS